MKLYFSTRHISALRELPLTQRLALLSQASAKLSAPEKLLLNVLKLIILVPAFVLILYAPLAESALGRSSVSHLPAGPETRTIWPE